MVKSLLLVEGLTVERGGRIVLDNLTFSLGAGEAILVTGRNGAGKSTLIRALCGLLPANGGQITYALADDKVRGPETIHYLGYEDALKPTLSVGENLAFWAAMLGGPSSRSATPSAALAALGIARLEKLPAAYLSAGQKRRVALARLLLTPRPIWLLDEPMIALDTTAQATLTGLMAHHLNEGGAILAASHQQIDLPCRTIELGAMAPA